MTIKHGGYELVFKGDRFTVFDENGEIAEYDDGKKISHRIKVSVSFGETRYDWKGSGRLSWKS